MSWVNHPCPNVASAPFKKYKQFAIDSQGKLFGRKTLQDSGVEIAQKPKGAAQWTDVTEFYEQQEILAACGGGKKNRQKRMMKRP